MSVIGKMNVLKDEPYKAGQHIELQVVCEDAFMANYHPENENVVFTRYSPSGSASFHFDKPVALPKQAAFWEDSSGRHDFEKVCELYLVYQRGTERPNVAGAAFFAQLRCNSRTEYGTDMKTIELCGVYHGQGHVFAPNEARLANIKLGIDNPPAADQFVPGTDGWWVVAYRADQVTMHEALALAHAASGCGDVAAEA